MGTIMGIIEEHELIQQAAINKIRFPDKLITQPWVQVPCVVFASLFNVTLTMHLVRLNLGEDVQLHSCDL